MSRGRLFGSKELTRTPIADVMAGVGGKLGGAYAQNVHQSRAQQRADEQREAEYQRKLDLELAKTGGYSAQEQARRAELDRLEAVYDTDDIDEIASQIDFDLDVSTGAQDRVGAARDKLEPSYEEEIKAIAGEIPGAGLDATQEGVLGADGVLGPDASFEERMAIYQPLVERYGDFTEDLESETAFDDEIGEVAGELEILRDTDPLEDVRGGLLFRGRQKSATEEHEERIAEKEAEKRRLDAISDKVGSGEIVPDTFDDEIASVMRDDFGVEHARTPYTTIEQIGQNVRAGMGPDGGEMAKARQRLADSGFYGARDGSEDPRFEVLRERFPDEALTTVDAVNRALSFTNRLEDRYKEEFDAGREETTQGRHLRREWSGIADQRQRQWELTRRASEAYQKAREEPLETDDEAKQRVRLAQGEMLAAAADITGINAGGNIEDIQSRADAGSGPIASIANMILAYREGHTLKPGAVDDLAKMIHAHGQLAFENWHDEFEAYKRTAAEDDFTIDRWAPANTHPTPREEAEGVWKALTNFEEF